MPGREGAARRRRRSAIAGSILLSAAWLFAAAAPLEAGQAAPREYLEAHFRELMKGEEKVARFRFGVIGDTHIESQYGINKAAWVQTIARWKSEGCLLGFVTGDLGYGQPHQVEAFATGIKAVDGAPVIVAVMGNHELDEVGKRAWVDAVYPGVVPEGAWNSEQPNGNLDRLYYSFNVGRQSHFVCLDGNVKGREGRPVMGMLGREQMEWLRKDLAENRERNVFVFIHEPIEQLGYDTPYYMLRDRAHLIEALLRHPKEKHVFSGHLHYDKVVSWRGITSVHTSAGARAALVVEGGKAAIDFPGVGEKMPVDFDGHQSNRVEREGEGFVIRTRDDGGEFGRWRDQKAELVGEENGVKPTSGERMLKFTGINWYTQRFIADQLIRIEPGMKFCYDIYLSGVEEGMDAVAVHPEWVMMDYSKPPAVRDQNGIALSAHAKTGNWYTYVEDLPVLAGNANGRWYHREFDLGSLAGNYIDGIFLVAKATKAKVGICYVDGIKFVWPAKGRAKKR